MPDVTKNDVGVVSNTEYLAISLEINFFLK